MLRLFFRFHRKLLNSLCLSAVLSLVKFLHTVTGFELMPGVVTVIQTFGDRINFHPHTHCLVTERGTSIDCAYLKLAFEAERFRLSRTAASASSCPAGTAEGRRRDGGIFLRASAAVFALFEDEVYLEPDD